jgi:hypothetical protein
MCGVAVEELGRIAQAMDLAVKLLEFISNDIDVIKHRTS